MEGTDMYWEREVGGEESKQNLSLFGR
jgi:hypothetical protein